LKLVIFYLILVSCGYNCNLNIWDFFQVEPVGEINLNEKFFCIKISNNGKFFAMGSDSGEIWIFKLPEFDFVGKSTGHSLKVNNLKWSPDDKQIISVSSDSSVCIWNFYKILN
jgi:WD40 repeat protein